MQLKSIPHVFSTGNNAKKAEKDQRTHQSRPPLVLEIKEQKRVAGGAGSPRTLW